MIEEVKKMLKSINNQELFDLLAEIYSKAFVSFLNKGFTREEAMILIKEIKFIDE